jgi:hypothetical protein
MMFIPPSWTKTQRFRLISYWNQGPSFRLISYWKRLQLAAVTRVHVSFHPRPDTGAQ